MGSEAKSWFSKESAVGGTWNSNASFLGRKLFRTVDSHLHFSGEETPKVSGNWKERRQEWEEGQ